MPDVRRSLRVIPPAFVQHCVRNAICHMSNTHKILLASQGMAQRNIVVKSFSDVPMADVEMIFPEKAVFIKPFVLIQLIVTVVLAVITVVTTLIQVSSV